MIKHIVMAAVAVAGISVAMPAGAEEIGVGVGPAGVGVTVGNGHGDRYRDREVIREREYRDVTVAKRLSCAQATIGTAITIVTARRLSSTAIADPGD